MSGGHELTTTQEMFGRRLRPFWGESPSQLIVTGLFRGVLYGAICWAVLRLAFDTGFISDTDVADTVDRFSFVLIAIAVLLALAVLYNVARIVIGVLGLVATHYVDGVVLEMHQRHRGDFLPGPIRQIMAARRRQQSRSGERYDDKPRRTHYVVKIENPDGVRSYNIRPKFQDEALRGRSVRLTVSGYNGYVRSITPVADDPDGISPQP